MRQEQREFADFYEDVRDDCLRVVLAGAEDPALAEDMVAEAFARAWSSWRTVREHPKPAAWVVRTALNIRVSWWRRRRREVVSDQLPVGIAPESGTGVDTVLMRALRQLPARQREVVALRVFLDLDTQGTAAVLGIAEGTVKTHLSRAMAVLRGQFSHHTFTGGER
jgi:RNA polymerase sigma-70 factor (sigma-E family)